MSITITQETLDNLAPLREEYAPIAGDYAEFVSEDGEVLIYNGNSRTLFAWDDIHAAKDLTANVVFGNTTEDILAGIVTDPAKIGDVELSEDLANAVDGVEEKLFYAVDGGCVLGENRNTLVLFLPRQDPLVTDVSWC